MCQHQRPYFVCLFAHWKLRLLREVTNKQLVKKGGGKKNAFLPFPAPPSLILNKRTTDSMLFLWTRLQYFQGQFLFFSVAKTSVTHRRSVTPSRKLFLCSVLFKCDHMQRSFACMQKGLKQCGEVSGGGMST